MHTVSRQSAAQNTDLIKDPGTLAAFSQMVRPLCYPTRHGWIFGSKRRCGKTALPNTASPLAIGTKYVTLSAASMAVRVSLLPIAVPAVCVRMGSMATSATYQLATHVQRSRACMEGHACLMVKKRHVLANLGMLGCSANFMG